MKEEKRVIKVKQRGLLKSKRNLVAVDKSNRKKNQQKTRVN